LNKFEVEYWAKRGLKGGAGELLGRIGQYLSYYLQVLVMRSWIRRIRKYFPCGRLLDVGCGIRGFLLLARESYECYGIDISKFAVKVNRKRGVDVVLSSAEAPCFKEKTFDIITCFDVLEHLNHPRVAIHRLSKLLKGGGIIVIRTPNIESIGVRVLKSHWHGYLDNTHVSMLPKDVWIKTLKDNGLQVKEVFSDSLFFVILRGNRAENAKVLLRYLPCYIAGILSLIAFGLNLKFVPIGENLCIVAQKF